MAVTVHNIFPKITEALEKATPQVRYAVATQVLAGCNYFARKASGFMIERSLASSDTKNGHLVWDTDYALKVYYYGVPDTTENPNASLMWCEKAKSAFMQNWLKIVANGLAEAVKDV